MFCKLPFFLYFICNLVFSVPEFLHADENAVTEIYFFYSKTCAHCREQDPYMRYINANNKNIDVKFYDIQGDKNIWESVKADYGIPGNSVPRTIIGEKNFIGFSNSNGGLEYSDSFKGYIGYYNQIISAIEAETGEQIKVMPEKQSWHRWLPVIILVLFLIGYIHPLIRNGESAIRTLWFSSLIVMMIISLFVLASDVPEAKIHALSSKIPFSLFVFILALADGFNPCAFSVFIIFLSLLSHNIQKTHAAVLGSVFIFTSAIMYFIFIMIIITAGSLIYFAIGEYLFILIGAGMIIAGILNFKEYWFFKKGITLTISGDKLRNISKKAGRITSALKENVTASGVFTAAVVSTVLLSVFVNLIELGCTAILPAVYMINLVKRYGSSIAFPHIGYTLFYSGIYVVPLIILLIGFRKLFPSRRINESQGRTMKLFSGLLMLMIGFLLVFQPESLNFH